MSSFFKSRPGLILVFGAIMISFSSVLVKISHVDPIISAFYRSFFGGLCLLPACFIKKDFKKRGAKNNFLAVACGFFFACDLWAWHQSIHFVGPGFATILSNFQVFILTFAGIVFFNEKLKLSFIFSVPAAFLGLFLLIGMDITQLSDDYYWGVVLGLATALFYGIFLLLLRKIQSDAVHSSLFYYQMVFSLISAAFLGLGAYVSGKSFIIPDIQSLLSLLVLGCGIQAMAWALISNALPKIRASHAGLTLLLQPALSFVWDVWFFNRSTSPVGWTGFFIVLIAIYFGMGHKQD